MLNGNLLPRTDRYRYLGALLSPTGCVGPSLLDLEHRVLQKTGTFVGWARSNEVPASVLGKLWCLYIEPLVWFLVAAIPLSDAQVKRLDLLQRKVARMLFF